jgi:hypothetical protein
VTDLTIELSALVLRMFSALPALWPWAVAKVPLDWLGASRLLSLYASPSLLRLRAPLPWWCPLLPPYLLVYCLALRRKMGARKGSEETTF